MLELQAIVDRYLKEAVNRQKSDCEKEDAKVIAVLNGRNIDRTEKVKEVRGWLKYYAVLQGLNKDDREGVSEAIIEFADTSCFSNKTPDSKDDLLKSYYELYGKCSSRVRLTKKGTPRDLTSLTSKALWCCYPDSVPIYDSYALRALWIISRLLEFERPKDGKPYERFASVWLDLYCRVSIDGSHLRGYPYKYRVFDKILWIIGQPDFGLIPYR